METDDEQDDAPLCQRCGLVPSTGILTWDERHLIKREDVPPGASVEDYTPAYRHLCRRCFEDVFHPVEVRTPADIQAVLEDWRSAERLVEGV